MRHLIFILSFFFILTSCEKEVTTSTPKEDQKVEIIYLDCNDKVVIDTVYGPRAGAGVILYLTSLSTDNALIFGAPRKFVIYNQAKIKYIKFTGTGGPEFGQNNILHYPYFADIVFTNDSIGYDTVSIGYTNGQNFTHYPSVSNNLLANNHSKYKVTYIAGRTAKTENVLRNQTVNLSEMSIFYDNETDPIVVNRLQPTHKGTNRFSPDNKY